MITVTVLLPQYLYQWALSALDAREVDGKKIVFPAKGSPISQFLRNFLIHKNSRTALQAKKLNHGAIPVESESLLINIPRFPGRDPEYYNYLPIVAEAQLRDLIRSRFDLALFTEFSRFENVNTSTNDFIHSWMDSNGIDPTEQNWNAIAKRLQLLHRKAIDRQRKNKEP